jgi:hypothetical protein
MTYQEQLDLWVEGKSLCPNDNGECCPDFSCCNPNFLAPLEIRKMFKDCPDRREALLFGFLENAISSLNKKVYLTGKPKLDWK